MSFCLFFMLSMSLFHNRSLIFAGCQLCKGFEAFGEVLGVVKVKQIGNLRHVVLSLPDQPPCFLYLEGIIILHNSTLSV